MTITELAAIATGIAIPVDQHGRAQAYVGSQDRRWRVYLGRDGGRVREWVGPEFSWDARGHRQAIRLAALINDERPGSRSVPETTTALDPGPGDVSLEDPRGTGTSAPEPTEPPVRAPSGTSRRCANCGRALPPESRSQRRFCDGRCRAADAYARRAGSTVSERPRAASVDGTLGL